MEEVASHPDHCRGADRIGQPAEPPASIGAVSHHRVPQMSQVDPDLVRPSGVGRDRQAGEARMPREHPVAGQGGARLAGPGRDPGSGPGMAPDGHVDLAPVLRHRAVHQGQITLLHLPSGELSGEMIVYLLRLGHHQESRGPFVQPVHDSRPDGLLPAQLLQMVGQGVGQGPAPVAGSRMHHLSRRLVHHQQARVLVEHGQGNRFRRQVRGLRRGRIHPDLVSRTEPVAGLAALAEHQDPVAVHPAPDTAAAELGEAAAQVGVQAPARVAGAHPEADGLGSSLVCFNHGVKEPGFFSCSGRAAGRRERAAG